VIVNRNVVLPKHQQIPIQNMDIIEFGAGNKYVYTFRVQSDSSEVGEEPVAKKRRIPLANRNCPSLKDDGQRVQQLLQEKIVLQVSMKRIWLKEFFIIIFLSFWFSQERLEEERRLKEEAMKELEKVRGELRVLRNLFDGPATFS
jgi:hypothetical protein